MWEVRLGWEWMRRREGCRKVLANLGSWIGLPEHSFYGFHSAQESGWVLDVRGRHVEKLQEKQWSSARLQEMRNEAREMEVGNELKRVR